MNLRSAFDHEHAGFGPVAVSPCADCPAFLRAEESGVAVNVELVHDADTRNVYALVVVKVDADLVADVNSADGDSRQLLRWPNHVA